MSRNLIFNFGMICALILGGAFGFSEAPFIHGLAETIRTLFMSMLRLISLPMIFLAIVSTLTRMTSLTEAGTLLKKIVKYTLLTTLIAATVGLAFFLSIDPVKGGEVASSALPKQLSYLSFVRAIIPENIVQPFLDNNVLGMAFIGAVLSIAILQLPSTQKNLLRDFFGALFDALLKITSTLILLMPIGVFAFTIQLVQNIRAEKKTLEHLLLYGICVIGANLIQGFVILPLLLKIKKLAPKKVAKGMLPALVMAFFSKSSSATLPLTLDCMKNRLGVSDKTARFSLPLCSIINMNGCAAFILITIFFVCGSQGITFTLWEMIPWIFLATLAAVGNAGVPMGCFFLTTAFLVGMGASFELMGIILPLYSLFDMVETALNVWSDSCVTAVVDREMGGSPTLVESNESP